MNGAMNFMRIMNNVAALNVYNKLNKQTKTSILTQSSQAMLAQSLKLPQGVLELLK